jgi:hypothetical protein
VFAVAAAAAAAAAAFNTRAQGNLYYDVACCGIGFHGDSERRKVVAVRLGAAFPLQFQWFMRSAAVGRRVNVELKHGDMYVCRCIDHWAGGEVSLLQFVH